MALMQRNPESSESGSHYVFQIPTSEVFEAMPELVKTDNDVKFVNQIGLIAVLINALKDQDSEIKELKLDLLELRNSLNNSSKLDDNNVDGKVLSSFQIFPNPVKGDFRIVVNQDRIQKIIITDLTGSIKNQIDISSGSTSKDLSFNSKSLDLAAGIYLFNAVDNQGEVIASNKVVISE